MKLLLGIAFTVSGVLLGFASGDCRNVKTSPGVDGNITYSGQEAQTCSWTLSLNDEQNAAVIKLETNHLKRAESEECLGLLQIPGHGGSCHTSNGTCFLYADGTPSCTLKTISKKASEYAHCEKIFETVPSVKDKRVLITRTKAEQKSFSLVYEYYPYQQLCGSVSTTTKKNQKEPPTSQLLPLDHAAIETGLAATVSRPQPQQCDGRTSLVAIVILLGIIVILCLFVIVWMHRRYNTLLSGDNSASVPLSVAEVHVDDSIPSAYTSNIYSHADENIGSQKAVYAEIAKGNAGSSEVSPQANVGQASECRDVYAVVNKSTAR